MILLNNKKVLMSTEENGISHISIYSRLRRPSFEIFSTSVQEILAFLVFASTNFNALRLNSTNNQTEKKLHPLPPWIIWPFHFKRVPQASRQFTCAVATWMTNNDHQLNGHQKETHWSKLPSTLDKFVFVHSYITDTMHMSTWLSQNTRRGLTYRNSWCHHHTW